MSDEVNEMSAASRGSQAFAAWAVVGRGVVRGVYVNREVAFGAQREHACDTEVIRMVSLTDQERLLIESAAEEWEQHAQHWRDNDETVAAESDKNAAVLRGLLERLG